MVLYRVLYDKSLGSDVRVKLLNVLSVAALKDDMILLHQDRAHHHDAYAFDIDQHPLEEQLTLAQFLANMRILAARNDYSIYLEWQHQDQNISSNINNIRMTIKVAVHSLLSNSEALQIRGAAIIHNLVCKEIKNLYSVTVVVLTVVLYPSCPINILISRRFSLSFSRNSSLQVLRVSKTSY